MAGLGYFGQFQLNAWKRIKDVDLVAICDPSQGRREAASKLARANVHDDIAGMLAAEEPDILDIASPPASHREALETAIGKVDTIICQKPFCTSLEEAERMVALAEQKNTKLVIHENFRFQPWYRVINEQIKSGLIGKVQQAQFRLRPGRWGRAGCLSGPATLFS